MYLKSNNICNEIYNIKHDKSYEETNKFNNCITSLKNYGIQGIHDYSFNKSFKFKTKNSFDYGFNKQLGVSKLFTKIWFLFFLFFI